jgi:CubicO group peptidase (beta-lactamase class C family)
MAAAALLLAHRQGLFDFDAPVARYWPEFAARGKQTITVRQLLGHQAGLPVISRRLTPALIRNREALSSVIAAQPPAWQPGSRHGYHVLTLGWYESELIRRTDPQHRSLSRFFADEIAGPLGGGFYIRPEAPDARVPIAELKDHLLLETFLHWRRVPAGFLLSAAMPWSLTARALTNPFVLRPSDIVTGPYESAEIPSVNGFGTARAIARIYSEVALNSRLFGDAASELARASEPRRDAIMRVETAFSLGFMKAAGSFLQFSTPAAFGMPGLGGSFGFADPGRQLAFCYITNRMDFYPWNDPRELALRTAVYSAL